jgi:hypothetical protein
MTGASLPSRFCLSCGAENRPHESRCRLCRDTLEIDRQEELTGVAFVLNELPLHRRTGMLSGIFYDRLRTYYLSRLSAIVGPGKALAAQHLDVSQRPAQPVALAAAAEQAATRAERARPLAASLPQVAQSPVRPKSSLQALALEWLPEQQANLLLYLGAFLVVAATLTFVGSAQDAVSPAFKMTLVALGTCAFLAGGLFCLRNQRVRQAGAVFLGVAALMVPLNFVGAYVFFLHEDQIDPSGLWLGASLACALFYGAVSFLNLGRWYPVPAAVALISALTATGSLLDPPVEAFAWTYVTLGLIMILPATLSLGRASEVLGKTWWRIGHILVDATLVVACLQFAVGIEDASFDGRLIDLGLLWLGLSSASLAFFATAALTKPAGWYRWAAALFLLVQLASILSAADAPNWSYPVAYALLASGLAMSPYAMRATLREVLFEPFWTTGHVVALGSGLLALSVIGLGPASRWFLPATGAPLASFYWLQSALALRSQAGWPGSSLGLGRQAAGRWLQAVAFLVSGVSVVSLAYALELETAWYGLAALGVASVYIAALFPFGLRWPAHQELGSLALLALAVAVAIPFLAGAALATSIAGLGACLLYLVLARLSESDARVFPYLPRLGTSAPSAGTAFVQAVSGGLPVHLAALALCAGFSGLLGATSAVDVTSARAVAWAFFGLSVGMLLAAASLRRWWPQIRVHVYAAAVAVAAGAFAVVIDQPGPVAAMLATLAAAGFAASLWERQRVLMFPASTAALCAFLAGWRYVTPEDAYAPLVLALLGAGAMGMAAWQRQRLGQDAAIVLGIGLTYVVTAPAISWLRFAVLVDPDAVLDVWPYDPTLAYQVAVAACAAAACVLALRTRLLPSSESLVAAAAMVLLFGLWSWARFGHAYATWPDQIAAMHLSAAILFICVAFATERAPWLLASAGDLTWTAALNPPQRRLGLAMLVLSAGWALDLGFYYALQVLGLEPARDSDLAWAFFCMAVAQALLAAGARWTWASASKYAYVVAIATSVFALFTASDLEGQSLFLVAACAGLSLAFAVWEREPKGLLVSGAYGFAALLAAQRYFEIDFAVLTLTLTGSGLALYAARILLAGRSRDWVSDMRAVAFSFATGAPVVAGVRLVYLAAADGLMGDDLVETWLYQAMVLSVFGLGLLVAVETARARNLGGYVGASVLIMASLLMEIVHFQPDNPQAYSVPIGLYFLGAALLASRLRLLPRNLSFWQERLYGLGPAIIMAPSFIQSLHHDAWGYGVILLAESLLFLALAILERRVWLLTVALSFVVSNVVHYAVFGDGSGEGGLPSWALLAIAGILVMAAGTAILMGRDRWSEIQASLLGWWDGENGLLT